MSHTVDLDSKYALPKIKTVASSQKRLKTFAAVGAGVLTLWVGALGAVAFNRHSQAQALANAQLAQTQAAQAEKPAESQVTAPVTAHRDVAPSATVAINEAGSVAKRTVATSHGATTKSTRRTSSHGHLLRSSTKSMGSRTVASKSASEPSAKRMKDDQLDALLKQFK